MTFKEARAEARKVGGACVARFKDGEWFSPMPWGDARNVYFVKKSGELLPLTTEAKKFLKKKKGA